MRLGIIGGTGLTTLSNLEITHKEVVHTPFGAPSAALTHGRLAGKEVVFLARHGYGHTIPPHKVNYRANLWTLQHVGVDCVLAIAAVGGITADMAPGRLVVPDQIIDYTYGRDSTFFENDLKQVRHIDFTHPYDARLRELILRASRAAGEGAVAYGCYGATQGPRLETAAEINRMERDGCDLVGMTGMPETALARELDLCYATCAVVANWAAGRGGETIEMSEIEENLRSGMEKVRGMISALVPLL